MSTLFHGLRIDGRLVHVFVRRGNALVHLRNEANPHPRAYETEIAGILTEIWNNEVGRILIDRLAGGAGGHRLTIVPYQGPVNAVTSTSWAGFSVAGGGTGAGANVTIAFTPRMYGHMGGAGNTPASTLVHEMVHALRDTRGQRNDIPMNAGYDNREEFFAVTIQSMFDAAGGRVLLRTNHGAVSSNRDLQRRMLQDPFDWVGQNQMVFNRGQEQSLPPRTEAMLSQAFGARPVGRTQADQLFTQYGQPLRQLVLDDPDLCQLLAKADCHGYNPVAIALVGMQGLLPAPPQQPPAHP